MNHLDPIPARVDCAACDGYGYVVDPAGDVAARTDEATPCGHCKGRAACDCEECRAEWAATHCVRCGERYDGEHEACNRCRCSECDGLAVVGAGGAMTDCPRCSR